MRACLVVTFLALCLLINSAPLRWQWTEHSAPPSQAAACHFSVACSRPFTSTASLYPPPEGMHCPKPMPLSPYISPNFPRFTFQLSGSWHLLPPGCPSPTTTLLRLAILREVLQRWPVGVISSCLWSQESWILQSFVLWKHVKKRSLVISFTQASFLRNR